MEIFGNFKSMKLRTDVLDIEIDSLFLLVEKSYEDMLRFKKEDEILKNKEDRNRNILKKYMVMHQEEFKLNHLVIVAECTEEDENYNSIGYTDLKIFNFSDYQKQDKENKCIVFECKCLNKNYSSDKKLKKHYLTNGVERFKKKYPSPFRIGVMISFIQIPNKNFIERLKMFIVNSSDIFIQSDFKKDKKYPKLKTHKTKHSKTVIYHLFLDFSPSLTV